MAEAFENIVGGVVNTTETVCKDAVEIPTNVIKETASAGESGLQKGVNMTEQALEETEEMVASPFDNFLDQLTDCFGLLPT